MSDTDELGGAVQRFVTAERALLDLRSEQQHLMEATKRFLAVDAELRTRTETALSALDEVRARLREQMEAGQAINRGTGEIQQSLTGVANEFTGVLKTLKKIDPSSIMSSLDAIEKKTAEQGAQLRKGVADLQRSGSQLATAIAAIDDRQQRTERLVGRLVTVTLVSWVVTLAAVLVGLAI